MPNIIDEQVDFERLVPDRPSPGQLLKMAREMHRLSPDDIAKQLNLRVQWIIDIENDHYSDGVALIYVKGYLQSYAKLVDASVDDVLKAFKEMKFEEAFLKRKPQGVVEEQFARRQPVFSYREKTPQKTKKRGKFWGAIIVAGVVVAGLLTAWFEGFRPTKLTGEKSADVSSQSLSATDLMNQFTERDSRNQE